MANWYLLKGSSEDGIQNIKKSLIWRCRLGIEEITASSRRGEASGKRKKKRMFRIKMAWKHEPFLRRLSKAHGYSVEREKLQGSIKDNKGGKKMNGKELQEKSPVGKVFTEEAVRGDMETLIVPTQEEAPVEVSSSEELNSQDSLPAESVDVKSGGVEENRDHALLSRLQAMIKERLQGYDLVIGGLTSDKKENEETIQKLRSQVDDIDKQLEQSKQARANFVDSIINILS